MVNWIDVDDSERVSAVAYDEAGERIIVRFVGSGVEWEYRGCPPSVWAEFTSPGASKGLFIHEQLNNHDHGPYSG